MKIVDNEVLEISHYILKISAFKCIAMTEFAAQQSAYSRQPGVFTNELCHVQLHMLVALIQKSAAPTVCEIGNYKADMNITHP
jgi:hypothetical protein